MTGTTNRSRALTTLRRTPCYHCGKRLGVGEYAAETDAEFSEETCRSLLRFYHMACLEQIHAGTRRWIVHLAASEGPT